VPSSAEATMNANISGIFIFSFVKELLLQNKQSFIDHWQPVCCIIKGTFAKFTEVIIKKE